MSDPPELKYPRAFYFIIAGVICYGILITTLFFTHRDKLVHWMTSNMAVLWVLIALGTISTAVHFFVLLRQPFVSKFYLYLKLLGNLLFIAGGVVLSLPRGNVTVGLSLFFLASLLLAVSLVTIWFRPERK